MSTGTQIVLGPIGTCKTPVPLSSMQVQECPSSDALMLNYRYRYHYVVNCGALTRTSGNSFRYR